MIQRWVRFEHQGKTRFGTLEAGQIQIWDGVMYDRPTASGSCGSTWHDPHFRPKQAGWRRPSGDSPSGEAGPTRVGPAGGDRRDEPFAFKTGG